MIIQTIIIGNVVAFLLVTFFMMYRKKQKMLGRLTPRELMEHNKVLQHKYFTWLNPYAVQEKAKKATWDFNFKKYWLLVMAGVSVSLIFIFLVLRLYYLFPLGILGGFALPNVMVFLHHRKRKDEILNELSAYINTAANLTMTFNDPYRALSEIVEKEFVEEPLLSDLHTVVRGIENGVSMKDALHQFENKYTNQLLNVFHDNLVLFDKYGGKNDDVLMQVAKDYDRALERRLMYRNDKNPKRQSFYTLIKVLIAFPFVLLGFSYDYYVNFLESPIGQAILFIIIAINIFAAIKIEFKYDKDDVFADKV